MKVRFYRGPLNGKVKDIDPSLIHSGRFTVARTKGMNFRSISDYDPSATFEVLTDVYEMRMMGLDMNGVRYRSPAMHPDGSLYMEWTKPKGSRK